MPHLIAQITVAIAGLIYVMLALTSWSMLRDARDPVAVRLWSLGAVGVGLGVALLALRDVAGGAATFVVSNLLITASLGAAVMALRKHLGLRLYRGRIAAAVLLACTLYGLTLLSSDYRWRAGVSSLNMALGTALVGWHAGLAHRTTGSRSVLLLSRIEYLVATALLLRGCIAVMGWTTSVQVNTPAWDWFALLAVMVLVACYGNLGYLGLVLDDRGAAVLRSREAALAETLKREAAERQADALRQLLDQRDRLASERERLLNLLAHEIRQPLHNASGALQAANAVLRQPQADQIGQAAERLRRADAVLSDVRSVLDNTLAAATVLSRHAPLTLQETELDFLADLALGDLPAAQRSQVQVQILSDLRSAELEPGLVRLALRNLLRNALHHGGAGVQVWLRIEEQQVPPALLLSVLDNGPGLPPADSAGPDAAPLWPDGLGLNLARQVVALHSGHLLLSRNTPRGLVAQLVLPLPGGDDTSQPR